MNGKTALILAAALLTVLWAAAKADVPPPDLEEPALLRLVLQEDFGDGGFTVVETETSGSFYPGPDKDTEPLRKLLREKLMVEGVDLAPLIDRLIEVNRKKVPIKLDSDPAKGYVFDTDGMFRKYFAKGGGGWEAWYRDHPKARGITTVSRPVYDPVNRLVLVYKGRQEHALAGAGFVYLYRLEAGKLVVLGRIMLWIS